MKFIDSHCHLNHKNFNKDITEVILRSKSNGIEKILLPNISSRTTNSMLQVCVKFSNCYPMMGLHPCEVQKENYNKELQYVKQQLKTNKYIAIREIGLDLYWNKTNLDIQ